MLLSRQQILEADDLVTKDIEVPEWGGTVRIRALTGAERDKLEQSMVKGRGPNASVNMVNFRARMVVAAAVDEAGHALFISEDDVKQLGNKSSKALDRLAEAASRLSGMSEKDIEELTQGFDDAQSDDSTSD